MKHRNLKRLKTARWLLLFLLLVPMVLYLFLNPSAEVAIVNAQVLTVDTDNTTVTALLIRNQRIVALGSDEFIKSKMSSGSSLVDMKGKAVLPGFIDAHSHFPVPGLSAVSVNLAPPPVGPAGSKEALLSAIAKSIPSTPANKNARFVVGYNYDNTAFENPAHPTRFELDDVSNGYPIYLWHNSGHLGVANSAALERLNIDESTPPVEGGARGRTSDGQLNGLLLEKAAPSLTELVDDLSWLERWSIVSTATDNYLAAGVTTVQNGYSSLLMQRLLNGLHAVNLVPQRVVTWLSHDKLETSQLNALPEKTTIKIIVDGSPQGLTAYMSAPFLVPAFGPENAGIQIYTQNELDFLVSLYHLRGFQLALHGNGDAAVEQIIQAVGAAQKMHYRADPRHILVHAQLLRPDQIARMGSIGLTPSFFTSHTFFWGDWHRNSFGESRAAGLSPAASAEKSGLRFSLHADTPVTPMDVLMLLWAASERETRSGAVLGASERISRQSALKAVTIDAAWQSFIDHEVGSLELGKYADLVVLSENPITASDIRQVVVEETWIGGRRRYSKTD